MCCLCMDVLEVQIGKTWLRKGLDINVVVWKRGCAGTHEFREKVQSY